MDMREQLYMLEIEKHRGIKDAAQALHISPPALSIFLGNLEERTGTKFFDRIGKQFVPTEAGKIYLEHAKEMIKIEAHYENELQKYMGGSSGTIRFGIHPRRTLYLLAKALPVFSARYPDVKLVPYEESTEQMIRHMLAGELDFAIVNESSSHPLLEYRPLYEDYMVAVVSAGHPLCTGAAKKSRKDPCPRIDLKQFNGERFSCKSRSSPPDTTQTLPLLMITPNRDRSFSLKILNLPVSSQQKAMASLSTSTST